MTSLAGKSTYFQGFLIPLDALDDEEMGVELVDKSQAPDDKDASGFPRNTSLIVSGENREKETWHPRIRDLAEKLETHIFVGKNRQYTYTALILDNALFIGAQMWTLSAGDYFPSTGALRTNICIDLCGEPKYLLTWIFDHDAGDLRL